MTELPSAASALREQRPYLGLAESEASRLLAELGPNRLPEPSRDGATLRYLRRLAEPMSVLLIAAAGVTGAVLRQPLESAAIGAIVLLNAFIASVQQGKAERALERLRELVAPDATVVRDGMRKRVPAEEVVVGDLAVLTAGDKVPADVVLRDSSSLEIDESVLTGESIAVEKQAGGGQNPMPENIAYAGTIVARGSGLGSVVAAGASTKFGEIAARLTTKATPSPLQLELGRLTRILGVVAAAVAGAIFLLTVAISGFELTALRRAFLTSVALAVAAVPEGLATVVIVALALGARRMAARGAIVRDLSAVETLGSTTVILADKTGTLTENRMKVAEVTLPGLPPLPLAECSDEQLTRIMEVAVLCNDATVEPLHGDPLDIALLEAFSTSRIKRIRSLNSRLTTATFDSTRRMMTTLHFGPKETFNLLIKGAPEAVLMRSTMQFLPDGSTSDLSDRLKEELLRQAAIQASEGRRILALARRTLESMPERIEGNEAQLTFVALVALKDPVRLGAPEAVAESIAAGIKVVMVTGDHPGTASRIAEEVGLAARGSRIGSAADLHDGHLDDVRVFARVAPDEKLTLVDLLQAKDEVVAVTGDGVNDAPALRRAEIGVAMGRGTDAAKESADMVLSDDNLGTIVAAVREGRAIYDNLRKVVEYLVAANLSEVLVVVAGLLLFPGLGVPLLPLQLLWINLLTDGLPAIALGLDSPDPAVMSRRPRPRRSPLLGAAQVRLLGARAFLIAAASLLALGIVHYLWNESWPHARGLLFTAVAMSQLFYSFSVRRQVESNASLPFNFWLFGAVAAGLAMQAIAMSWGPTQSLLGTHSLGLRDWLLAMGAGLLPVALIKLIPWLRSRT